MKNMLIRLCRDEHGAVLAEYALMAVLIAAAAVATVSALGDGVGALLQSAANAFSGGGAPAAAPVAAPGVVGSTL